MARTRASASRVCAWSRSARAAVPARRRSSTKRTWPAATAIRLRDVGFTARGRQIVVRGGDVADRRGRGGAPRVLRRGEVRLGLGDLRGRGAAVEERLVPARREPHVRRVRRERQGAEGRLQARDRIGKLIAVGQRRRRPAHAARRLRASGGRVDLGPGRQIRRVLPQRDRGRFGERQRLRASPAAAATGAASANAAVAASSTALRTFQLLPARRIAVRRPQHDALPSAQLAIRAGDVELGRRDHERPAQVRDRVTPSRTPR